MYHYDYVKVPMPDGSTEEDAAYRCQKVIRLRERGGWKLVQAMFVPEKRGRRTESKGFELIFQRELRDYEH